MNRIKLSQIWTKSRLYVIVGSLIFIFWFSSWLYINSKLLNYEQAGQFGDKFGFVNSIFSGLAFGGIVISLFLQRKELSLQRKELRETRKEFSQQNFESTFFNLLKNQQDITHHIEIEFKTLNTILTTETYTAQDKKFFIYSKALLRKIYRCLKYEKFEHYDYNAWEYILNDDVHNPEDEEEYLKVAKIEYDNFSFKIKKSEWDQYNNTNESELNKCKLIYLIFLRKYDHVFGHYFRHLTHILLFLEDTELKEITSEKKQLNHEVIKKKYNDYAQFVQAQMSSPELVLLYYNCLISPNIARLVIKFGILDNLSLEDILTLNHNNLVGINLKKRLDIKTNS